MRDLILSWVRWAVWIAGGCLGAACVIWIVSLTVPSRDYLDIAKDSWRPLLGLPIEDPWRKWAYDYQGILGGILAVVAASFTVAQMRISEAENNRRHRESVDLQVRADRLRVERMLWPQTGKLKAHYLDLCLVDQQIMSGEADPFHKFRVYADRLKQVQTGIVAQFNLDVWKDASDLLDARLTNKQADINKALRELSVALNMAEKAERYEVQQRSDMSPAYKIVYVGRPDTEWEECLPRLIDAKIDLETRLEEFFVELDSLARIYKIDL